MSDLVCMITGVVPKDPVVTKWGDLYDRQALTKLFKERPDLADVIGRVVQSLTTGQTSVL